jgi:DNA-directed RNA polymerase specialized sigma subunit
MSKRTKSAPLTKDQADLVAANAGLAIWYAKPRLRRGDDFDELVSACNLGLISAARRYDSRRGSFSNYAAC